MGDEGGEQDCVLVSKEGHRLRLDQGVAACFGDLIRSTLEEFPGGTIPLLNVSTREMEGPLLSFARRAAAFDAFHALAALDASGQGVTDADEADEARSMAAAAIVGETEGGDRLRQLLLAAHYLDNRHLYDAATRRVAEAIAGKTPQEIRTMFGLPCNLSREEEEFIRSENAWAFR